MRGREPPCRPSAAAETVKSRCNRHEVGDDVSGRRVRRAGGAQGAAAERLISQWNSDQKSTARRQRQQQQQQQRRASSGGAPEMMQQGDGGPDETDGHLREGQLSAASRRYWVLIC
jgi:hypothetical protein